MPFPLEASGGGRGVGWADTLYFSLFYLPSVEDEKAKVWSGKECWIVQLPEPGPAGHVTDLLFTLLCS